MQYLWNQLWVLYIVWLDYKFKLMICRTTMISNNLNENSKAQTKCIQAAMHSAAVPD